MSGDRFDRRFTRMRRLLDAKLGTAVRAGAPKDLTEGCRYVLAGGGKRVRGALVLLSCEAVGGRARDALNTGLAVETLHNFTLVHDDIMDNAPARRGRPTVHTRWDVNNALLVGDVLVGLAFAMLLKTRTAQPRRLVELLTRGLLDVCEGQALDLEFSHRSDVTVDEYFHMIEKKTGRLFGTAAELGAAVGGGSAREAAALRAFGHHLGRAFQIQDDLLDVTADRRRFGKAIGGDIMEGKRTFLMLKALERARGKDRAYLRRALHFSTARHPARNAGVIAGVTDLYRRYGVIDEARTVIGLNTTLALKNLEQLRPGPATGMLRWLSELMMNRES